MTVDGLSGVPALNETNVSISVGSVTDAAQGAPTIVVTSQGFSVIVDAVDLVRKIFQRIETYVISRISSTL